MTTTDALSTTTPPAATSRTASRPRLWLRLSITRGNLLQVGGTAAGAALIALAGILAAPPAARLTLMVVGWLAIYDCTHSIGHYIVGRAVGIRFRFYGIRGTDHPEDYPAGLRQLMSIAPFWSVITDKASMRAAAPWRKALMFAAGETSTTLCSTLAAYAAASADIPGGHGLLMFTIVWNAAATIVTAVKPKGDYAKARRALRTH
jgi:hypothetical protein